MNSECGITLRVYHRCLETLCEIRKTSEVPVILLTAQSEAEDKRLAFQLGVDDYITKPFNKIEVAENLIKAKQKYMENGNS